MARKSRIGECQEKIAPAGNAIYKVGIYARLSSEGSGADCLENQIFLLKGFVEAQLDMSLVDAYEDFGFTGTNFERPGFERLMEDAKRGRINCIVVKDLSRLGRELLHLMVKSSVAQNKTSRDTIQLDFLQRACKVAQNNRK